MPHDRKGNLLAIGDRVKIPVVEVRAFQVLENADAPNEYAPFVHVRNSEGVSFLEATIVELYPTEEACNAEFAIDGVQGTQTFNTRLVERIQAAEASEADEAAEAAAAGD